MAQTASDIARDLVIAWLANNELKLEIPATAGQVIGQIYRDLAKAVGEVQPPSH
jgi:hypothetical protein